MDTQTFSSNMKDLGNEAGSKLQAGRNKVADTLHNTADTLRNRAGEGSGPFGPLLIRRLTGSPVRPTIPAAMISTTSGPTSPPWSAAGLMNPSPSRSSSASWSASPCAASN